MTRTADPATDTRERLLEAGGAVFSESGFRAATVRHIVTRAGANLAAVNYHFGDKEGLYAAVLEHYAKESLAKHPPQGGLHPDAGPEEQLHAFVRAFLLRILDKGHQAVHGKMMAREMIEPTAALDRIVEQMIRPLYGRLCAIVKALAGPDLSALQVQRAAKSVVGQCLFYKHCAPVLQRLDGALPDLRDIDLLVDHIVSFSVGGIRALGAVKKKGGAR
ncbi:MAG TPA: CerR family C-terminal domain-containing protein [Planctomycetota bacterium]|jgi:AcrR family transcriptional regulator|nr:CerR family C-terminal domain-containing protein [Planctomycetota bacterium]